MLFSIVNPVFNEEQVLPQLMTRIPDALHGISWELIFVDDGSRDGSAAIIRNCAQVSDRIKMVGSSRNFGHQSAITGGLDFARGDAVAVMDADLKDRPELLPQMVALFEQGHDVVSPRRAGREGESALKIWTAKPFYRLLGWLSGGHMSEDVGDFRLFSRKAFLGA